MYNAAIVVERHDPHLDDLRVIGRRSADRHEAFDGHKVPNIELEFIKLPERQR